jgi:hypothetical protein
LSNIGIPFTRVQIVTPNIGRRRKSGNEESRFKAAYSVGS